MATNPASDPRRPQRTADEVNEEIRALWLRCGGRLSTDQRREYQRLVTEWATAEAADQQDLPTRAA
ncbi:hypothetical protein C9F11_21800 [Streptomyces sp. YIM 121038]|uniref:hypothetical protein n=1 Tax=Streptomyces sp. YIM 121038 TaxID=2136401 RepID=UPI0011104AF2|nr:hypothetical protein [Streptomyces sp. YIM 121038]QCX77990.1 hypothetical protein C9F11_21800 [Streptomyces sp. YIM 121038]